jgi:hypothetical protein
MQGVLVFASEAARDAAITSPQEGQFAYTKDNNSLWYYTGSAWAASGATGDIEGVTAGTGISGGGTSGTVTITNSMATAIDAKGDLVVGTGADTFARLAVGTNGHTLVADSAETTGLKWAAPAGGGKVLQVVQGTTTTRMQTTSTSYVDTNLSQAITPSSTTSKVLVLVFQNIHLSRSGTDAACQYKLVRTSTALSEYYLSVYNSTGGDAEIRQMGVFSYLDSPATTSATTYKTQIRSGNASTTSDVQENATSLAAIVLLEIGA